MNKYNSLTNKYNDYNPFKTIKYIIIGAIPTIAITYLILLITPTACTRPEEATKTLIDAGYTPIEVGGYDWFGCSDDDNYSTKFKAYSPNSTDRIVHGTVCEGMFKNKTIRLK